MHKLLARQVKRNLGVEEAQVPAVVDEFKRLIAGGGLSHDAAQMLAGLESFLQRVDESYQQKEASQRDLQAALTDLAHQKFALDQHAIVSITNPAGEIVYANDKLCEISGYARTELMHQNHRIIKSGFHDKAFFAGMWGTITEGKVWHGEICNRN